MRTDTTVNLEQRLLAWALFAPEGLLFVVRQCAADDWSDPRHRLIHGGLVQLHAQGMTYGDLVLLKEQIDLEQAGGVAYLNQLIDHENPTTYRRAPQFLQTLRQERTRLDAKVETQRLLLALDDPTESVAQLHADLNHRLQSLLLPAASQDAPSLNTLVLDELTRMEQLRAEGRRWAGLDSGLHDLNDRLNGLCPGELTVLAARPGMGKSALTRQIALHVADQGYRVGIISLEMTRLQMAQLLASYRAKVPAGDVRAGRLDAHQKDQLRQALEHLEALDLTLFTGLSAPDEVMGLMEAEERTRHVDLWVVDHLHRFTFDRTRSVDELGGICHRLADLALTHNTHVFLAAQLSRRVEERHDKRPQLADLRDSGQIEEHAVNALMIYRPGAYQNLKLETGTVGPNAAWLDCPKVRFGTNTPIELVWCPEQVAFGAAAPAYLEHEERYTPHI